MKLNWGAGIVIAIIAFMSFILYFVISMSTGNNYNHDLVSEEYYQKELVFQGDIDATKNAKELSENIKVQRVSEGLKIYFPTAFNPTDIKGKVFLYRPSNKQLDFEIPISISNTYLLVPEKRLLGGRWNIIVSWNYKNTPYLFEQELMY
ncbi:FixH family protein [Tenacibaculum finnmarkense]|uniref:FixH family protein n=1 Tax=Tenacibaculum finnmarkense TaxID=2781243 RepID=UPI001EFBF6CC|nr:FixH family protein [Tenacibaculum finnmarkense]MCG8207534.1 FixH family protein [Tenacibaculum finnmarkense genomovar finnmarkense]MCG8723645.1 FixH family protein [Tenacibaculum finnmarkense]MCG8741976.1 FixH family protein [Tenacibaculum finnmarkense]MCG8765355.1 FixH family protein [Tenacibaculum finnmarkense]MCG8778291.1 FixH family protein [Tenacibaculum finnmarkense]